MNYLDLVNFKKQTYAKHSIIQAIPLPCSKVAQISILCYQQEKHCHFK